MKVLITGASGFIGSHLVRRFSEAGHTVVPAVRQLSESLQQETAPSRLVKFDVLEPADMDQDFGAEVVIHSATANDILSRDFRAGLDLSVAGTRNVLEYAVRHKIRRVLFFSTLQVYGTELSGRIDESSSVRCQTAYGLNHYFGEECCRMYANNHHLDIALLRPSNVYGVPSVSSVDRSTLVPMCFVLEAVQKESLTLRSTGLQRRNFVSTDEVADYCLHLVGMPFEGCQIYNLCSPWTTSIREVADMTAEVYEELFGRQLPINILSDQPAVGQQFAVTSRLPDSCLRGTDSVATMRRVIRDLFDWFGKRRPAQA